MSLQQLQTEECPNTSQGLDLLPRKSLQPVRLRNGGVPPFALKETRFLLGVGNNGQSANINAMETDLGHHPNDSLIYFVSSSMDSQESKA